MLNKMCVGDLVLLVLVEVVMLEDVCKSSFLFAVGHLDTKTIISVALTNLGEEMLNLHQVAIIISELEFVYSIVMIGEEMVQTLLSPSLHIPGYLMTAALVTTHHLALVSGQDDLHHLLL